MRPIGRINCSFMLVVMPFEMLHKYSPSVPCLMSRYHPWVLPRRWSCVPNSDPTHSAEVTIESLVWSEFMSTFQLSTKTPRRNTVRSGSLRSRERSIVWWCASVLMCGVSMAWLGLTAVDSTNVTDVLSTRLVIGWMGIVVAAGFGAAGLWYWSPRPNRIRREPEAAVSAYDGVTGLPTRRLYLLLLGHALSRAEATMRRVAVLVCALEPFSPLSTSLSMSQMTLIVRVQAARIKSALRSHDVVARLDEYTFAVIADNLESADGARLIAEKIQHAMALPLSIEGHELLIACRIGGIVGPQQGTHADALLDAATEVLEEGELSDAGSTLIVVAPQPGATEHDTGVSASIPSPQESSLVSHR